MVLPCPVPSCPVAPRSDPAALPRAPRILFAAEAVALAHVTRPLLLARWAAEAGYQVSFACGEAYADIVRSEGFTPVPLPTVTPELFRQRVNRGDDFCTEEELSGHIDAESRLLARLQPDLIVSDLRLSLGISAALHHRPLLSLLNAYWSVGAESSFPPPRDFLPAVPWTLRRALFSCLRPLTFKVCARSMNRIRARYGLPALHDFRRHYAPGYWCAYPDLPGWVPLRNLPAGHFYLGPLDWAPRDARVLDPEELGRRRPLVYVSMGSTGPSDVLHCILSSLLELECDAVVSGVDPACWNEIRRKLPKVEQRCVADACFAPEKVLKRAALMVCHGGSGTIYQGLRAGVPVLSVTGNADQGLAAAAAARQGAGLALHIAQATRSRVMSCVATLLTEEHFSIAARRIARAMAAHDTRAHWLEFLKRELPLPSGQRSLAMHSGGAA
ncbi:MAG TPA: nucleotide disphospho-sugar-binding domain-containing protein [Planctomycetota bacterium]|nr:nucleotide disphospho-sugar-binding domain-containing protein [Planctomycetota bacterium]